jgi:hypothetical protein
MRSIHFPRQLALLGASALLVVACGGSGSTTAPSAAASTGAGASSAAASTAAGGGTASLNPIGALSGLTSYKLKITLASSGTTGGLAAFGNMAMSGTVVLKPDKAADMTLSLGGAAPSPGASAASMDMRVVEVNGKTWVDLGGGTLTESTDSSSSSMVDSFSPDKLLGSTAGYIGQMQTVGDETKNGIAATHYKADDKTLAAAAAGLAMFGLTNPKWSWDVWIAKDGGYVISYSMSGTGDAGSSMTMSLDITDVNSPSNVVETPS